MGVSWLKGGVRCALLLVLIWSTPHCVRLEEPDGFWCDIDSVCPSGQRCKEGKCSSRDTCTSTIDCFSENKRCEAGLCVPSECFGKPKACGNFACDDGICRKSCTLWTSGCAEGFYCTAETGGQCAPKLIENAACEAWDQCAWGLKCCGPQGRAVCAKYCGAVGDGCTVSPCDSGYCCAQGGGRYCGAGPCPMP